MNIVAAGVEASQKSAESIKKQLIMVSKECDLI